MIICSAFWIPYAILRKSITPPSSESSFCPLFRLIASIARAVYTSLESEARSCITQRAIFLRSLSIFSRAHPGFRRSLFLPFSRISYMCVRARARMPACVNVAVCVPGPHVVMLSEACDISCHASRTLQRHASRAPRSSPRVHISSGNAS